VPNKADLWVSSLTVCCSSEPLGIMIAITDADQSTHRGLRAGDWVLIDGMLAPNRQHVIAGDIWRDDKRGARSKRLDRRTRAKRDKGSPRGVEQPRIPRASERVESRPGHRMESARSGT
jgi:hypothetical protein